MAVYTAQTRLEVAVAAVCQGWLDFGADGRTPTFKPDPAATPEQIAEAQQVIADFEAAGDWRTYQTRTLWHIQQDVAALTSTQQDKISADLLAGSPPKVLYPETPNTTAEFCTLATRSLLSSTSADARKVFSYTIALYCADNPLYLVKPPFDTTINVPGWEPVP